MFKGSISVGSLVGITTSAPSDFIPSKPKISMRKTKEAFGKMFDLHRDVREMSDDNKKKYPRMHQSVRNTAWELIHYYIVNWGKPTAKNLEVRLTYSYLRKKLGESCCIATLKNHLNKLLKMYKGFLVEKGRGGLGLIGQNTACLVLTISDNIVKFEDDRHNQAIEQGRLSAQELHTRQQTSTNLNRTAAASFLAHEAQEQAEKEKRQASPMSFASIFQTQYAPPQKPK